MERVYLLRHVMGIFFYVCMYYKNIGKRGEKYL